MNGSVCLLAVGLALACAPALGAQQNTQSAPPPQPAQTPPPVQTPPQTQQRPLAEK